MRSVLVAAALSHIASSVTVTINPASIGTFTIPPRLLGVGIEYLNHEIYGGGLYSQMIFGESFEEAVGTYSPGGAVSIASATNPAEKLRHCNYDLYMTATDGSQDFAFKVLSPGLNGQANTVSFQSVNYPSYHISVDTASGVEAGRLGIVDTANTAAYRDASTFKQVAALNGNAAQHSYQAFGQYNGYYIASNGRLQGPCSGGYRSPDSDIVLEQNPSNKAAASWSLVRGGGQPPSENGYVSCGAGRASSGVQVSTISKMWMADYTGSGNADLLASNNAYRLSTSGAQNGNNYQQINFATALGSNGFTSVGIANYGLNCQLGLFIVGSKQYSGYVYLRNTASSTVSVTVSLKDSARNDAVLDSATLNVAAGNRWAKYAFTFNNKQSYNSSCSNDANGYFSCSGKFVIALTKAGDQIDVDLTYLSATAWGLRNYTGSGSLGLPARKDLADQLQCEGIRNIRMGGSMCNQAGYRWKDFRGPRDQRQPYQGLWYGQRGLTQSRGFGMFEVIDLCQEIGCDAVITFNNAERAADMADFVEYCWGGASTTWGAQRIADGHPQVYNVSWIEVGNEQGLNQNLLNQITSISAAMDAKVKSLGGSTPEFRYFIGQNLDQNGLNNAMTNTFINTLKPLGNRIFWDLHMLAEPQTVAQWESMVTNFAAKVKAAGSQMRWGVLEENQWPNNDEEHGVLRGLGHAAYHSLYIRHGDLGVVHGYANAIEAWQGMDQGMSFPQGQLFYTPNMTFGQPTFYVNKMLTDTYQPYMIDVSSSSSSNLNVVADVSSRTGSKKVNVYITNWGNDITVNLALRSGSFSSTTVNLYTLAGVSGANDEENSPSQPQRIYPRKTTTTTSTAFTVKRYSFVIATVTLSG